MRGNMEHEYRTNKFLQIINKTNKEVKVIAYVTKDKIQDLKQAKKDFLNIGVEEKKRLYESKKYFSETPMFLLRYYIYLHLPRLYIERDIRLNVDFKKEALTFYILPNNWIILGETENVSSFYKDYKSFEFIDKTNGKMISVSGDDFIKQALQYKGCHTTSMHRSKFVIDESTFSE